MASTPRLLLRERSVWEDWNHCTQDSADLSSIWAVEYLLPPIAALQMTKLTTLVLVNYGTRHLCPPVPGDGCVAFTARDLRLR